MVSTQRRRSSSGWAEHSRLRMLPYIQYSDHIIHRWSLRWQVRATMASLIVSSLCLPCISDICADQRTISCVIYDQCHFRCRLTSQNHCPGVCVIMPGLLQRLMYGITDGLKQRLQAVQNAATLIGHRHSEVWPHHLSSLVVSLASVCQRVEFKLVVLVFKALRGLAARGWLPTRHCCLHGTVYLIIFNPSLTPASFKRQLKTFLFSAYSYYWTV